MGEARTRVTTAIKLCAAGSPLTRRGACMGAAPMARTDPTRSPKGSGASAGDKENEVTVGWIEEYVGGFQVVVEGFYDEKTGTIEARFRSSRGVSGRFMLAPKPSIF